MENKNDLKINRIDVTGGDTSSEYAENQSATLNNVVIDSEGNIINAGKIQGIEETKVYYDKNGNIVDNPEEGGMTVVVNKIKTEEQKNPNITAEDILLSSGGNIGEFNTELVVNTSSEDENKGLHFDASKNIYISGVGEFLNIVSGNSDEDVSVNSTDTEIRANDITAGGNVKIQSQSDVRAKNIIADNDKHNSFLQINGRNVELDNAVAKQIDVKAEDASVTGNITTDIIYVVSSDETLLNSANIEALDVPSDNILYVISSGNASIINSIINGNTYISVKNDNAKISPNLYIDDSDFIGNVETDVEGNTEITSLRAEGDLKNKSAKMNVSERLDVSGDAYINADKKVKIADGHIKKNLNVDAKNLKIDEIKLDGNINASANIVDINTSNDLNIGYIQGKNSSYTKNLKIMSASNIINGLSADDTNIAAENIELYAGGSIGENNSNINIDLSENNSVSLFAGSDINLSTFGEAVNYTDIQAQSANISADSAVMIKNMNVDNFELETSSANTVIKGHVNKAGNIITKDKRIGIDNVNFVPDYSATLQLRTGKQTLFLVTDSSNNIIVDSGFIVRHGQDYIINGTDVDSSMESEAIKAIETNLKNSDRRKYSSIENIVTSLYETPQLSDESIIIKTINGEMATPENINEVINLGNILSENNMKTKKRANATLHDKISYFK